MSNYYHSNLILNFSNILIDGQPLSRVNIEETNHMRNKLDEIAQLEFFGMSSSIVSGEHHSSNLVFIFTYYKYRFGDKYSDVNELIDLVRSKISSIAGVSYSEIRVEFTRTKSLFKDLENERLYRSL